MEDQKLGYEIRRGMSFNYYDTEDAIPFKCEITNIINDGHYVIYEFKNLDSNVGAMGATIFPKKLRPIK